MKLGTLLGAVLGLFILMCCGRLNEAGKTFRSGSWGCKSVPLSAPKGSRLPCNRQPLAQASSLPCETGVPGKAGSRVQGLSCCPAPRFVFCELQAQSWKGLEISNANK